jgi:Ca2+-binding EF-hand superfamily protein
MLALRLTSAITSPAIRGLATLALLKKMVGLVPKELNATKLKESLGLEGESPLSKDQFTKALTAMGVSTDKAAVMFGEWDADNDGSIDFDEFAAGISVASRSDKATSESGLKFYYSMLDVDNSGSIDQDEFKACLDRECRIFYSDMDEAKLEGFVKQTITHLPNPMNYDEFADGLRKFDSLVSWDEYDM